LVVLSGLNIEATVVPNSTSSGFFDNAAKILSATLIGNLTALVGSAYLPVP
jgi:hypothetical protein